MWEALIKIATDLKADSAKAIQYAGHNQPLFTIEALRYEDYLFHHPKHF